MVTMGRWETNGGWEAGRSRVYLRPHHEGHGPVQGNVAAPGRALNPNTLLRLCFPGVPVKGMGAGGEGGCRAITLTQNPPCRADSLAHQSSGQISIRPSQARYPRPAVRSAAVRQRRGGGSLPEPPPREFYAGINSREPAPEQATHSPTPVPKPPDLAGQAACGRGMVLVTPAPPPAGR